MERHPTSCENAGGNGAQGWGDIGSAAATVTRRFLCMGRKGRKISFFEREREREERRTENLLAAGVSHSPVGRCANRPASISALPRDTAHVTSGPR
jgi:hypothetical protein